jgi:enoyl-CoA hydratase/carnithine racemase
MFPSSGRIRKRPDYHGGGGTGKIAAYNSTRKRMSDETVRYRTADRVATLTLDRPRAKNALGPEEWRALAEGVARAAADPSVRVLLLTGAGDDFSAGGDVKTMPERLALEPAERRARLLADAQVIRAMRELPKPIVARIDGACVGAGLSLALACDLRWASSRARFGATFHRVGLTGDFGLLHLLPRVVGAARAAELLLVGEVIPAERAEAIGLVHRLCEPAALDAEVAALCGQLADGPPVAQALTKAGLQRALEQDLAATLEWEAAAQAIASRTGDAREGLAALADKRPPRFTGR